MRIFKAWRYKCDFCGKNKHQKHAMEVHERGCTANPNRECRVHIYATGENSPTLTVAEMVAVLQEHRNEEDHGLKALRDSCDDCPCCILAALRQSGFCKGYEDEEGYTQPLIGQEQFNFKEELKQMWNDANSARADAEYERSHAYYGLEYRD